MFLYSARAVAHCSVLSPLATRIIRTTDTKDVGKFIAFAFLLKNILINFIFMQMLHIMVLISHYNIFRLLINIKSKWIVFSG